MVWTDTRAMLVLGIHVRLRSRRDVKTDFALGFRKAAGCDAKTGLRVVGSKLMD